MSFEPASKSKEKTFKAVTLRHDSALAVDGLAYQPKLTAL